MDTTQDAIDGPGSVAFSAMHRLSRFEHFRYVGDKRTQIVHDTDSTVDSSHLQDLLDAEAYLCFGPDTLAEARNRGYRACRQSVGS